MATKKQVTSKPRATKTKTKDAALADAAPFVEPTTRKQAEAHVRRTTFRHRPITPEDRTRIAKMSGDERMAYEPVLLGRCGADLTDLMAAVPYDGQEHTASCPKCGQPFTWRAPWFPGVDGVGEDGPTP